MEGKSKFLVDECTGSTVAKWLKANNFEVYSVYDSAPGISDDQILNKAFQENWVIITNDRDFSELIFRDKRPHHGAIFLRLSNERSYNKIACLEKLLK